MEEAQAYVYVQASRNGVEILSEPKDGGTGIGTADQSSVMECMVAEAGRGGKNNVRVFD